MDVKCSKPDCTVAQTGICLLNNNPDTCPERLQPGKDSLGVSLPPPLTAPVQNPKFPGSLTLSPETVRTVTQRRYFRLVGILGSPDAGKTAVLVSLYLLLSRNRLQGFEYADSLSIRAFDDISRGARRWNEGKPPEYMISHTLLADERSPGFLHLRLKSQSTGEKVDLLLPDLPGEWSNALIDLNRVDRLEFLKAADLIWLTVDGRQLLAPTTRQQVLHRTSLLLQRISDFLSPRAPRIFVVISHKDFGDPPESAIQWIHKEAQRFNLSVKVAQVSSFSDNDAVAPGFGISELLALSLEDWNSHAEVTIWPDNLRTIPHREALNFGITRRNV